MKLPFPTFAAALFLAAPLMAQPNPQPAKPGAPMAPAPAKVAKPKADKMVIVPMGTAYARVLHAIPDGPAVDVYLDGQKKLSAVAFKSLSDYMEVKTGKHSLKVTQAGKTEALLEGSHNATKGKFYTIVAYGDFAKAQLEVENDSSSKDVAGKAKVRVYDLAPGAPALLVTTLSTKNKEGYAKFVAKPLEFGQDSLKTVKPETLTLQVRGADEKVIKEVADVKLEAGKRYCAYAVGKIGGAGNMAFDILVKPAAIK